MHFEDQVVGHFVLGQFHFLQWVLQMTAPVAFATAGAVSVHNEVALCIVATSGTHRVDECLGIAVDAVIS